MAHRLYTTNHMQRRHRVAFAIAVVVAMASVAWVVMAFGEQPTVGVDWDRSQTALPSSNADPAAGFPLPDRFQSSRPIGITDLPGRLGGM